MPLILRVKGYRIWFYSADLVEPPHVHVAKENNEAKFWINEISLAKCYGFRKHEISEIIKILIDNRDIILETWEREQEKRDNR